jgi:membrane-associated phospholipid phosphatase
MRVIPNYEISPVHIQQPYLIEKALFGINSGNSIITPNEYFVIHNNSFFDFLAGLFYVNWVPIPLMFAIYLFYKDKYLFVKFSLTFVIINVIGFICYYIYPAAPPWYVELYGFDLHLGVSGNSAGLARFDELVHIPVFSNIFNKNANVLAAMPSLHSVNPIIVLYYGIKLKLGKINWFFVLFMVGIWFSAVYTNHHYIIDVLAGIVLAVICLFVLERLMSLPKIDKMIIRFTKLL